MKEKVSWYQWLTTMLKEFAAETATKRCYEIVDVFQCKKTGFTKAVIKLSERHTKEKNISDLVMDSELIENLDPKTVRTLTYMATVERLKPDYSIVVQHMTAEVDEYLLEIRSRYSNETIKRTPTELSKNKDEIVRFNPLDANRIGYMAGVRDTVKEFDIRNSFSCKE